jgi:hypothetical protein
VGPAGGGVDQIGWQPGGSGGRQGVVADVGCLRARVSGIDLSAGWGWVLVVRGA